MDMKDSSEDEDVQNISAFSKFDESIDVRNAEEIKSPINTAMSTSKRSPRSADSDRSTKITAGGPTGSINPTHVSRYFQDHHFELQYYLVSNHRVKCL